MQFQSGFFLVTEDGRIDLILYFQILYFIVLNFIFYKWKIILYFQIIELKTVEVACEVSLPAAKIQRNTVFSF